jgi:hypothetical protein
LTGPAGARARRQAFVEFVRANHPDVGGDPAVFQAGLVAFQTGRTPLSRSCAGGPGRPAGSVEVHRRRRGPGVLLDWLGTVRRRRGRRPRVH